MRRALAGLRRGQAAPGVVALGVAMVLAVAYLLAPPLGTDLSAQFARADFFAAHGWTPIDLRWYGGINQFGYSLVSSALMGTFGVPAVAVASLLVSSAAFAYLLTRHNAVRPALGAVAGAFCVAGNLASGRVTYALGIMFGLLALAALSSRTRAAAALAGLFALLASASSPVAGLFTGLAGVAVFFTVSRLSGAVLAVSAAVPMIFTGVLFGEGGTMNMSVKDAAGAAIASIAVLASCRFPVLRLGAALSAAGVLAAYALPTPVGLNATRLATMFAIPVLVAFAPLRSPGRTPVAPGWLRAEFALLVGALAVAAPPVVLADLGDAGNPASRREYFTPLTTELTRLGATRIEVVPTRDYWESAYVAPLARGWLRQLDVQRNPIMYEKLPGGEKLTSDNYRAWLRGNAVSHVALPDAELSWLAKPEAELIRSGLPYLTEVWRGEHWRLYAVADPSPIVDGYVSSDDTSVTFDAAGPGEHLVRIRYSPFLTMPGGSLAPGSDGWTAAKTPARGRYKISS